MSVPQTTVGVFLHAVGGFAAGSFYIPYKRVQGWAWESYWIVGGVFTWLIMPWLAAVLTVPDVLAVLREAPGESLAWTFLFGALWGIGGLTFGLALRYLGISLGMAVSLGTCALFGTIIPPLYDGTFATLTTTAAGKIVLAGLVACLAGISLCCLAGRHREQELSMAGSAALGEGNYSRGVWVATFAGVMSACFALAMMAGKPIAETAERLGSEPIHRNAPVMIVLFAGGFLTNLAWCLVLNVRNRTAGDYVNLGGSRLLRNYFFSALAGTIAYLEFFFYGMGTTKMGKYDFSSWTIHMAFIIVFSNLWGLCFREWAGTTRGTRSLNLFGLGVLILSTVVVGYGNYLAATFPFPTPEL